MQSDGMSRDRALLTLAEFLSWAAESEPSGGAKGLEVYHPNHTQEQTKHYLALAKEHGLLITGGSDYHGEMLEQTFKLGDLQVPYACYQELKAAKERLDAGQGRS